MSYHNNSASTTSTTSSGSSGSGGNTYTTDSFVKEKDGVVAPLGFHYMDDGTLMSDAEHIRLHGYAEKKITSFDVDTKDINYLGETRSFIVNGNNEAVFSLEIHDDAAGSPTLASNYYNFNTKTWSSLKTGLYNIELTDDYTFSIVFPVIEFTDATCDTNSNTTVGKDDDGGKVVVGMTVTGSGIPAGTTVSAVASNHESFTISAAATTSLTNTTLTFAGIKKYTINLFAKTVDNIKTKHAAYSEVRNPDNTVNLNKSTGSSSDLIRKTVYQDIKKNLYLSCIAPSLTTAGTPDQINQATGSATQIIIDGDATDPRNVQIGDKVTTTGVAAAVHALVTEINPDGDNTHEIKIGITDSITDNHAITFTPAFNGMTPNGVVSTTGQQTLEVSSGGSFKRSFSITCTAQTGRTLTASRLPTTADLCAYTTVTFGADPIVIHGEDITSSTHYGWPMTNIVGLQESMILDPARPISGGTGENTTTPATISRYLTTKTDLELVERKYYTDVNSITVDDKTIDAVSPDGNLVTAIDRNGVVTAQKGNIIFSVQQANALKADANVRIFGYGARQIKSLTGIDVAISDVVITPTQVSTTTTGAVSASATIPVTEAGNISTAQTIRGVGISSSVRNPTVSLKSGTDGEKNLTASAAQTLESGQTLFFDGASNILTITGTIVISNMNISDTTLYLDVERFLIAR